MATSVECLEKTTVEVKNECECTKMCFFGWEAKCKHCDHFELEKNGPWCAKYKKPTQPENKACDDGFSG